MELVEPRCYCLKWWIVPNKAPALVIQQCAKGAGILGDIHFGSGLERLFRMSPYFVGVNFERLQVDVL